jgi:hypothetical protein
MTIRKQEERGSSLWRLRSGRGCGSVDSPRDFDKLHLFSLTQHRINSINYLYVYATCFGLYYGYLQARQYKTLQRKINNNLSAPWVLVNSGVNGRRLCRIRMVHSEGSYCCPEVGSWLFPRGSRCVYIASLNLRSSCVVESYILLEVTLLRKSHRI